MKTLNIIKGLSKQFEEASRGMDTMSKILDVQLGKLKSKDPDKFKQFADLKTRLNKALANRDSDAAMELITEINSLNGPE
jgi:hypothetical protein